MKMIQKAADKAMELLVPQTTATADQGYWEYKCVPDVCGDYGNWWLNSLWRRYCRESWHTSWEFVDCC